MTAIPENEITAADMQEWYRLKEELTRVKAAEMLLRTKIYHALFKNPVEGTNTLPLQDGWVMKAKRVINRSIDLAALQINSQEDPDTHMSALTSHGINPQKLVAWKPELVLKEYRTLTEEQQKIFNECLVIKDGSPDLSISLSAKG